MSHCLMQNQEIIKVGFQNQVDEDGKRRTVRINKKTNQPLTRSSNESKRKFLTYKNEVKIK